MKLLIELFLKICNTNYFYSSFKIENYLYHESIIKYLIRIITIALVYQITP